MYDCKKVVENDRSLGNLTVGNDSSNVQYDLSKTVDIDREVVAAMNIARKGEEVFQRSKGLAGEEVKGNPTMPVILSRFKQVDFQK